MPLSPPAASLIASIRQTDYFLHFHCRHATPAFEITISTLTPLAPPLLIFHRLAAAADFRRHAATLPIICR
jgi:hypothetical protein